VSVYHMGGIGSLWSSIDDGASWARAATLPSQMNVNGLAVGANGRLAIGFSGTPQGGGSIRISADMIHREDTTGDLPGAAGPVNSLVAQDGWFFKTGGSVEAYRRPHPIVAGVAAGPGATVRELRVDTEAPAVVLIDAADAPRAALDKTGGRGRGPKGAHPCTAHASVRGSARPAGFGRRSSPWPWRCSRSSAARRRRGSSKRGSAGNSPAPSARPTATT